MGGDSLSEDRSRAKIINKRYANVERIKEAEIIGILIGTVVCDNHMDIINMLRRKM